MSDHTVLLSSTLFVHATAPCWSWKEPLLTTMAVPCLIASSNFLRSPCILCCTPQSSLKFVCPLVLGHWSEPSLLWVLYPSLFPLLLSKGCVVSLALWIPKPLNEIVIVSCGSVFWYEWTIFLDIVPRDDDLLAWGSNHLLFPVWMSSCLKAVWGSPGSQEVMLPLDFYTIGSTLILLVILFAAINILTCIVASLPSNVDWSPTHHLCNVR